jgi:prepilin-type N-terminal cleavage/methylation domain-containing protein
MIINKKFKIKIRSLEFQHGFAMLEIILVLVVIGIIAANIITLQSSSMKMSGSSNKLLLAGQMIDRQIERLRMFVDRNPKTNFPPSDSTITENGITLRWNISNVNRTVGPAVPIPNVRECTFIAGWGKSKGDTLKVRTFLARNF